MKSKDVMVNIYKCDYSIWYIIWWYWLHLDHSNKFMHIYRQVGTVCPPNAFTCADGQCIPNTKVCNDVSDCFDNSDETAICKGNVVILFSHYRKNKLRWMKLIVYYLIFHAQVFAPGIILLAPTESVYHISLHVMAKITVAMEVTSLKKLVYRVKLSVFKVFVP